MILDSLKLDGKVAIITGAGRGLGRAMAVRFAQAGADVVVAARTLSELEQTAAQVQPTGRKCLIAQTDVTRSDQVNAMAAAAIKELGRIDILINNAGGPPAGTFEAFGDAQWQAAFELNLLSTVRLIRLVLPHMRKTGSGRIINIVSTSVKQPIDGLLLSNSIRSGVVGLAKTLSIELAPDNITVNNVCPGRILTDRLRQIYHLNERVQQGTSEEAILNEMAQGIPMGRIGKPEELGAFVAFLASRQAAYITGTTTQIDGALVRSLL